jgi:hypothetical protein
MQKLQVNNMPTNCDETVHERYAREHQELLEMYAKMTPEEIFNMVLSMHNEIAKAQNEN